MTYAGSRSAAAERFAARVRESGGYRWVGLYDVTPDEVILLAFSGDAPPAHTRFRPDAGLSGAAIRTSQPVVANDVSRDPRYLTAFASTGSEIVVPIVDRRGHTVGTLDVESPSRDAFGPADVERLKAAVDEIAPTFTDITVRIASPEDAAALVGVYAPYVENTVISFEESVPTVEDMRERVRATLQRTPWLVARNGADIVGYAYAATHRERAAYRWAVDTSVYVHERFRGRRVASRLYGPLFDILERQGFQRACAGIALPNDASVGCTARSALRRSASIAESRGNAVLGATSSGSIAISVPPVVRRRSQSRSRV